jgi:WD40 repeat protein
MNPGEGTVTALDFHVPAGANSPSHLLNGSADGSLTVWQVFTSTCKDIEHCVVVAAKLSRILKAGAKSIVFLHIVAVAM